MSLPLLPYQERIHAAIAQRQVLVIRGLGSKDFLGPPCPHAQVLDTTPFNGIISHEPSELVITAYAGTPLSEIEQALAAHGQWLPFDAPHYQGQAGTLGGLVAAGMAGPARVAVGGVRDHVLGLAMFNGLGQHLRFGGQVMKNVAGYDVSRLMAGSMGTLGLITEISLKVLPQPVAEATLMFAMPQEPALVVLQRWAAQPLPLNASCWVHDDTAAIPQGYLFVRLRGAQAAVQSAQPKMLSDVQSMGFAGQPMDTTEAAADWRACVNQTLPFFQQAPSPEHALWRLSVPATTPVLELPSSPMVEWHGGLRWVWATHQQARPLREVAHQLGGHATLWRVSQAHGAVDFELGFQSLPSLAVQAIQQRLQAQFDPHGVFRTARLFPHIPAPTSTAAAH
ncbi:MAG: glycolate oxidase subunit GlcE [Alphaproteobacteria bacterium]|nr:glycolate oxidase subunit GlcE [Alphaproteobacteria bacterium]